MCPLSTTDYLGTGVDEVGDFDEKDELTEIKKEKYDIKKEISADKMIGFSKSYCYKCDQCLYFSAWKTKSLGA